MNNPKRLSDIALNVDGFTQDDVLKSRAARLDMIRDGAARGNWFCEQSMSLDATAREYGIDSTLDEEMDDEDHSQSPF